MNLNAKIKPLTNSMKEVLMECHERQLMRLEPLEAGSVKHAKGLIERGLLKPVPHTTKKGKKFVAMYVTDLGSNCLDNL